VLFIGTRFSNLYTTVDTHVLPRPVPLGASPAGKGLLGSTRARSLQELRTGGVGGRWHPGAPPRPFRTHCSRLGTGYVTGYALPSAPTLEFRNLGRS
jgi:hypothetical protein